MHARNVLTTSHKNALAYIRLLQYPRLIFCPAQCQLLINDDGLACAVWKTPIPPCYQLNLTKVEVYLCHHICTKTITVAAILVGINNSYLLIILLNKLCNSHYEYLELRLEIIMSFHGMHYHSNILKLLISVMQMYSTLWSLSVLLLNTVSWQGIKTKSQGNEVWEIEMLI